MTREEIENDIVNTLFECTHSGEDDTISDKEFAEVLADKFIDHETDLLKEFVEYVIKQHTTEDGQKLVIFHQVLLDNLGDFIKERDEV